jgi:hypothetical protein
MSCCSKPHISIVSESAPKHELQTFTGMSMRSLPAFLLTSHLLVRGVSVGAQTCLGAAHSGTAKVCGYRVLRCMFWACSAHVLSITGSKWA